MAIKHRKLFPEPDSNQTSTCSDCGPTCPYDCGYPEIYWPPQPPPLPPHSATPTATHISPYVIIIAGLLGSAFLFVVYYLIMLRYCSRLRRSSAAQADGEGEDFFEEDHGPEVDHPIWYITTVGLQPSVINSITVVRFKRDENLIDGTDCSVCLSEFQDDETLRLLPKCNHAFHIPCIDTWLSSHTNCPLCRAGILSNSWGAVLSSSGRAHGIGSNRDIQMEESEYDAELGSGRVGENGICENGGGAGGLGSHTNCPLSRAGILSNTWSAVLTSHDRTNAFGSNQDTQMENSDNGVEFDANSVREREIRENRGGTGEFEEIQDSKTENESVIAVKRSISMDSVAEIVLGECERISGESTTDLRR